RHQPAERRGRGPEAPADPDPGRNTQPEDRADVARRQLPPLDDRRAQPQLRDRIDREDEDRGEPDQAELGWRETPREHEHDDVVEADGAPLPQGGPRHAPLGETPQLGGLDAVLDHATASSAPGRAASSTNPAMAP